MEVKHYVKTLENSKEKIICVEDNLELLIEINKRLSDENHALKERLGALENK